MATITINEALNWRKTLQQRHLELTQLRNENSREEIRYLGAASGDRTIEKKALYDAKELDKTITGIAREMRLLDNALKKTNAVTKVKAYNQDDAVLGELK
jgi:hypothetical protein